MIIKPAKDLALLLQTKVILERADAEVITRLNSFNKQLNIISNSKDIFASNLEDFDFKFTKEEAFEALAEQIKIYSARVKFHLLPIPITKAIEHCNIDINNNVIVRSIEYYEIRIDEILTRYDILIEKVT